MNESLPTRRRRWHQFGLRTLFVGVTATGLALLAYRTYVEPYEGQRQTIKLIKKLGGRFEASDPTPWQRRLLGADHQNLVRVDLSEVESPEEYLPRVARLPCLEMLLVGGVKFADEHLQRLSGLTTLQELVLDSTSVSPAAVARWRERFPSLKVHQSQRLVIRVLNETKTLKKISVASNDKSVLTFVDSEHYDAILEVIGDQPVPALWPITRLPTLESLTLAGPDIGDDQLAQIGSLSNLVRLKLSRTQEGDAGLAQLKALPKLDQLDISSNQVTDDGLAHLAAMGSLESLDLSNTRVGDRGIEHLTAIPKLKTLVLSGTQLTDAGVPGLKRALGLRALDISYTQVTDGCLADLSQMSQLTSLGLRGTKVSGAALPRLLPLKSLESLDLRAMAVTAWELVPLVALEKLAVAYDDNTYITNHGLKMLRELAAKRPPRLGP